jgi:hypothetical protein
MSHDTHDTHHHSEGKKAVFGPPVIMGLAFWLFAFFFLSLCNPSHHGHEATGEGHEHGAKTEQVEPTTETAKATAETTPTEEAHH